MQPESNQASTNMSLDELQKRIIKEFLDMIILREVKEHTEMSGYDLAALQYEKYGVVLSPGTVYATLYSMERRGLISGHLDAKKTTYRLTAKGEKTLENIKRSIEQLTDFMKAVLPLDTNPKH